MTAPSGGLGPCGLSGVNGVPVLMLRRTRTASPGLKTCTASDAIGGVICRSGEMSSRIQTLRPYVATTRSLSLTTMSRYDVFGRFSINDCQLSPSSNETYMPLSVPAYSNPARFVSARMTRE